MDPLVRAAFERLARERRESSVDLPRRHEAQILARVSNHTLQYAYVTDPHRFTAVRAGRRAGKTLGMAARLLRTAIRRRNSISYYFAATRQRAKELGWSDVQQLDDELELGLQFRIGELTIVYPSTGGEIRFRGVEDESDAEKYRGGKADGVVIDEAKSWRLHLLEAFIDQILRPALADRLGWLTVGGSPGSVASGTFWRATGPDATQIERGADGIRRAIARPYSQRHDARWDGVVYEWSTHAWTARDNPLRLPDGRTLWDEALELKRVKGWSDENPIWVREWLGEWCSDDGARVYRYDEGINTWRPEPRTRDNPFGLPAGHAWRYAIGLDLGFRDPFALQVAAFAPTYPDLLQVYEYEELGMTVSAIVEQIAKAVALCGGYGNVVGIRADYGALGGALEAELQKLHGVHVERAEKRQKLDHIELQNSDLVEGRIKALHGSRLVTEWQSLQWDDTRVKERVGQKNNNADAWLYLYPLTQHRFSRAAVVAPQPHTPEWHAEQEREEIERITRARRNRGGEDLGEWSDEW